MPLSKSLSMLFVSIATLAGWMVTSFAQPTAPAATAAFPAKPIRILVGTAPGGAVDFTARTLAQRMIETSGNPTVVENRPGAGTTLAAAALAKSPPDGYTLYMASTSFTVAASLAKHLPYDSVKDFIPVTLVAAGPLMLSIRLGIPASNMQELIAWVKSGPGKMTYGTSGAGSSTHLTGELLRLLTGANLVHVPYKGSAPSTADLIGGHVDSVVSSITEIHPHVKAGKVRAIAVTASRRSPLLPDVPTMAEAGFPGAEVLSWYGILAPAGTPREVVARLHEMIVKAMADPATRARMTAQSADVIADGPDKFGPYVRNEIARWSKIVQDAGIRID